MEGYMPVKWSCPGLHYGSVIQYIPEDLVDVEPRTSVGVHVVAQLKVKGTMESESSAAWGSSPTGHKDLPKKTVVLVGSSMG